MESIDKVRWLIEGVTFYPSNKKIHPRNHVYDDRMQDTNLNQYGESS